MDKLIIEALNKNSEIEQLKKEQEILLEAKVEKLIKQYELEILLLKNIIKYLDVYLENAYLDLNEKLDDKAKKIMEDTIRLNSL